MRVKRLRVTELVFADSLLGRYVKPAEPLAVTTGSVVGPGGPEVVTGTDGNQWVLYHSWESDLSYRSLTADRIECEGDVPVLRGPSRASQPAPAAARGGPARVLVGDTRGLNPQSFGYAPWHGREPLFHILHR